MFLQIHSLTSYHASLLNRDDAGLAKRIPFGDATRLRVSSQCLKRHWRQALQQSTTLPSGVRSREFFSRIVFPAVIRRGVAEALARTLTESLVSKLVSGGVEKERPLFMKQPALFGRAEADFFIELVSEAAGQGDEKAAVDWLTAKLKTDKKNFKAMLRQAGHGNLFAGVEGALFGRFVTSDILSRADAAVHVAHSFTVHPLDSEVDYFTVVDDLNSDEESGAAHAGDMELGSGLFYNYIAVDIPLLVANFSGCERSEWREHLTAECRQVLAELIRAISTVTPGAKLGATAPYAFADLVLLESGAQQPRSLANAYLQALSLKRSGAPMQVAVDRLGQHLQAVDAMYGESAELRSVATTQDAAALPETVQRGSLNEAIEAQLQRLFGE